MNDANNIPHCPASEAASLSLDRRWHARTAVGMGFLLCACGACSGFEGGYWFIGIAEVSLNFVHRDAAVRATT
jgi:hypothetical protein